MIDQCVNVVRVAPVVPLGAAIVIILTFTAAVMLIYADLKVFEKGRTWYSRIVWYMPMFSVMALIVLQFVKLSCR